jgi:hypothetical protein
MQDGMNVLTLMDTEKGGTELWVHVRRWVKKVSLPSFLQTRGPDIWTL